MSRLTAGWRIQRRVVGALMIRELVTRFGRENIGFLWIMAEPLLFTVLVGVMWRFMKGPEEHGVSVIAFVAETVGVVREVLSRRPNASLEPATELLEGVGDAESAHLAGAVQLWPHRHGTDAMFVALLRRV